MMEKINQLFDSGKITLDQKTMLLHAIQEQHSENQDELHVATILGSNEKPIHIKLISEDLRISGDKTLEQINILKGIEAVDVNNAENARQPLREMEDNRQRKKYQIEQDFIILMRKIMKVYQLSDELRGRISDEQRLYNALIVKENIPNSLTRNSEKIEFMKQFPLFYTHATLVNARDRNLARPILPGDLIDIVSYVVPIVYFDFLVGENYFINLAKQEKLDQDFGCVLLNRLEDLEPELRGLL